jgi:hypothetical protein
MTDRKRAAALDAALKGAFKRLEDRGVPEHVMRVVDQLDEQDDPDGLRPSPGPRLSPEP